MPATAKAKASSTEPLPATPRFTGTGRHRHLRHGNGPQTRTRSTWPFRSSKANTRYLFCVTARSVLTGTSLAAFQADAAAEIDRQLQAMEGDPEGLPRVLPAARMRQIQRGLLAAIERRTNRTVTTRSGSVFDTSTTRSSAEALPGLRFVIEQQILRSLSLDDLETQFDGIESAAFLGGLDNHPALGKIVGKLDPGQAVPGLSAAVIARAVATAGVLLKPRPAAIALTARGEMPLDPTAIGLTDPAPLATLWSPAPLAARIVNLEESSRRIAELQSVVEAIPVSPGLQGKLGITPTEATELSERLDEVRHRASADTQHVRPAGGRAYASAGASRTDRRRAGVCRRT